jgi:glutamate 5-kinase
VVAALIGISARHDQAPRRQDRVGAAGGQGGRDPQRSGLLAWWRILRRGLQAGQQIIVVSSGAIALGARRLQLPKGGRGSLDDAQAAAAVGQIALSGHWAQLLGRAGPHRRADAC